MLFLKKFFFVVLSLAAGITFTYYIPYLFCSGPIESAPLIFNSATCYASITKPAIGIGLLVFSITFHLLFTLVLRYSFKEFLVVFVKLILYIALIFILILILAGPINNILCEHFYPKPKLLFDEYGLVIPGTWGLGCKELGFIVLGIPTKIAVIPISMILASTVYLLQRKTLFKKKS